LEFCFYKIFAIQLVRHKKRKKIREREKWDLEKKKREDIHKFREEWWKYRSPRNKSTRRRNRSEKNGREEEKNRLEKEDRKVENRAKNKTRLRTKIPRDAFQSSPSHPHCKKARLIEKSNSEFQTIRRTKIKHRTKMSNKKPKKVLLLEDVKL
jgi:hypothetical protein